MELKDPTLFFPLLIIINIIAYSVNMIISILWDRFHRNETTVSEKEVLSSLGILLINILITIPGFILWSEEIIVFSSLNLWLSFISLFLIMDFLMYVFHWASHNFSALEKIHTKHHEHSTQFNCISLYYMSPWESILLGALLTVITVLFSFNIYGFILFLFFNWIYGVMAHLNIKSNNSHILIFTTTAFHKTHHELKFKNYGFYTFIWDKVFRTEKK